MTQTSENIVDLLRHNSKLYKLNQRAEQAITAWLNDAWQADELPEGAQPEQIRTEFSARWLCFESEKISYPFIDTRYNLYMGEQKIGYYRLITSLNGEDKDDYFVLNSQDAY